MAPPVPERTRRRSTRRPRAWLVVPALLSVGVAATPLVYLGVRTAGAGERAVDTLLQARTGWLVLRSLGLAVVVTAACVAIGVALAWLVVRSTLPGRRVFAVLGALPLAIPTYVAAYTWISALPHFDGFWAAALVLTLHSFPYVFLPVAAALRGLDPAAEEVSRALGRTGWQTFRGITLRQLRPAVASGALLVALYVLSDFGAVSILRFESFTYAIFTSLNLGFDRVTAVVLGTVLVAITALIVLAEGLTRGRARYARLGGGARRTGTATALGHGTWPAFAGASVVAALSLGVPLASITYWSVRGLSTPDPWDAIVGAAVGSLTVAALGMLVTVALALPVGLLAGRHRGPVPFVLERATWLSHALPGIVVGLSLVFLGVNVLPGLYQTTTMLAIAYAVLFLPLAVGAIQAAVAQSPPALEDVARSLGRRPLDVLRTITLPLTAPGIGAGALLVFLTVMKELPATLLLRPTGLETLATGLWTQTGVAAYAAAAPYAALLVLLSAVPTYLLGRRTGALRDIGGKR